MQIRVHLHTLKHSWAHSEKHCLFRFLHLLFLLLLLHLLFPSPHSVFFPSSGINRSTYSAPSNASPTLYNLLSFKPFFFPTSECIFSSRSWSCLTLKVPPLGNPYVYLQVSLHHIIISFHIYHVWCCAVDVVSVIVVFIFVQEEY